MLKFWLTALIVNIYLYKKVTILNKYICTNQTWSHYNSIISVKQCSTTIFIGYLGMNKLIGSTCSVEVRIDERLTGSEDTLLVFNVQVSGLFLQSSIT